MSETLDKKKAERREESIDRYMGRCVYFTGVQNKTCKAGVNYDEMRGSQLGPLPCFQAGLPAMIVCDKKQLPTREQAEAHETEMSMQREKSLKAMRVAHEDASSKGFGKGHGGHGEVKCPLCELGMIRYSVASYNGHMHAGCTSGCVSWME